MTAIILSRGKVSPYRTERVPKKAEADTAEQNPGRLCWGDAGEMPPLVPVGIGFVVVPEEEHVEVDRETEPVKIYSEDGSMFVDAARTKALLFEKKDNASSDTGTNKTTGGSDLSSMGDSASSFSTTDASTGSAKMLKVTFTDKGNSL